jgi:hypothetical protein
MIPPDPADDAPLDAGRADGPAARSDAGQPARDGAAHVAGTENVGPPARGSPIARAFLHDWSGRLPDSKPRTRDRLMASLAPLVEAATDSDAGERRRFWMLIDWLVRQFAPAWLRLAKLDAEADALMSLEEIDSPERAGSAIGTVVSAKARATVSRASTNAAAEQVRGAEADKLGWVQLYDDIWARDSTEAAAPALAAGAVCVAHLASVDAADADAWDAGVKAWDAVVNSQSTWEAAWSLAGNPAASIGAAGACAVGAFYTGDDAATAALNVAWSVGWDAARDINKKSLNPLGKRLRESAARLVTRMCNLV